MLDKELDALTWSNDTAFEAAKINDSFSIGIFNTEDDHLLHEYHFTGESVASGAQGVRKVDANSVYRIGSVSKLLTAYVFLISEGDSHWNQPITRYIPELAKVVNQTKQSANGILPCWEHITIVDLATHLAGLTNILGNDDRSYSFLGPPTFPELPNADAPRCNIVLNHTFIPCDRKGYFDALVRQPAAFAVALTPIYSNTGADLIALALENITGLGFAEIFERNLVQALCLNGTSYTVPNSMERGVVPGQVPLPEWSWELGIGNPDGGMFSTINDMSAIGRAILKSTQIPVAMTRRWMKPHSFTSDYKTAIGAPWEIARIGDQFVYDAYTKAGTLSSYRAQFNLIPDFNLGVSILAVGDSNVSDSVNALIASYIFPALESIARAQASDIFTGQYAATDLNSSIIITTDEQPGLRISSWISNGTDILRVFNESLGNEHLNYVDFRLYPNQLYSGKHQIGFTGSFQQLPKEANDKPLPGCASIFTVGAVQYGNVGIESFVFDMDSKTGKVVAMEAMALRLRMEKV